MLDIDLKDTILVSHGVQSDMALLEHTKFPFKKIKHRYCTYTNAKRLLGRKDSLTLRDVAAEGCYFMFNEHNAYADVWGTLYAFCYLKDLEQEILNDNATI